MLIWTVLLKCKLGSLIDDVVLCWAVDEQGPLEGATTAPLHALWYLRKTDVDATTLRNIGEQLVSLESTHG